jgi:SAM-dependent methyltransferase
MGDFARTSPLDPDFGYGRGTPIDRYYIEGFLSACSSDIRGHVLEIGDASYSLRFGSEITRQDVLHIAAGHPSATIIGDLSESNVLPAESFDCMVLTQTLHLIYDVASAVRSIHAALRPGGAALVTVPGITRIDRGEWNSRWFWSLTHNSARRLFGETFGHDATEVQVHGNIYAAICFLQGMALEEVDRTKLDVLDDCYPVIITIRAVRQL